MRLKILLITAALLLFGGGAWFASQNAGGAKPTAAPLTSFDYFHRGASTDSFYSYEVAESENEYVFRFRPFREDDEQSAIMSTEDATALMEIINRHNLWKWHGFSQSDPLMMDGTSFSLRVAFADGTVIEARGSNRYPSTYSAACAEIDTLFSKYIKELEN